METCVSAELRSGARWAHDAGRHNAGLLPVDHRSMTPVAPTLALLPVKPSVCRLACLPAHSPASLLACLPAWLSPFAHSAPCTLPSANAQPLRLCVCPPFLHCRRPVHAGGMPAMQMEGMAQQQTTSCHTSYLRCGSCINREGGGRKRREGGERQGESSRTFRKWAAACWLAAGVGVAAARGSATRGSARQRVAQHVPRCPLSCPCATLLCLSPASHCSAAPSSPCRLVPRAPLSPSLLSLQSLLCDGVTASCVMQWYYLTGNSCDPPGTPQLYSTPQLGTCGVVSVYPEEVGASSVGDGEGSGWMARAAWCGSGCVAARQRACVCLGVPALPRLPPTPCYALLPARDTPP